MSRTASLPHVLRTLLDYRDSRKLSENSKKHIVNVFKKWPHTALTSRAHWPPRNTENHDLMHLTIGLFALQYRGDDISGHVREIKKFIAHRIERGFVEWNSKCYQYHFSNPLIILPDVLPHKRRYEARGRVVQHKNWLLGQGALFEDGGAKSHKVGRWNVYQVGKGLCAHMELTESYCVLQVSDLDTFADEESFVAALSVPEKKGDRVDAVTMDGDRCVVNLTDMSISINDSPRPHPPKMLHDCEYMMSEYGSGKITIKTTAGSVTFEDARMRTRPAS